MEYQRACASDRDPDRRSKRRGERGVFWGRERVALAHPEHRQETFRHLHARAAERRLYPDGFEPCTRGKHGRSGDRHRNAANSSIDRLNVGKRLGVPSQRKQLFAQRCAQRGRELPSITVE